MNSFTPSQEYFDKFIKFQVIATDGSGISGAPVTSDAIGPIDVNVVNNPSFENNGLGWLYHYANIKNTGSYQGDYHGRIATGADYDIKQILTVPETGNYNLSAYVYTKNTAAQMGMQTLGGEVLQSVEVPYSDEQTGYIPVELNNIPLEAGEELAVFFSGATWGPVHVDNVKLAKQNSGQDPVFNQVIQLQATMQSGVTEIDKNSQTIHFVVPYATDLSQVQVSELTLSPGTQASISEGDNVGSACNEPMPVSLVGVEGDTENWTISCTVRDKEVAISSSSQYLEDAFSWAMDKTKQFVMTDKNGLFNRDENNNDGDGRDNYKPSYWAGYFDRTAFYSRDFLHQSAGGHLAGLEEENLSMFQIFAGHATESRKWYTLWAINFNGIPHSIDYYRDDYFVREVPAQFEFLEKAYEQYLWTGNTDYINNPDQWQFYTKVVTDYIDLHDTQDPNGIAEGYGGIFEGSATYNERGEFPIEAGDAIGSQYQAFVAYAGMLKARGDLSTAAVWREKAAQLKTFFNTEWSIKDPSNHDPLENYVNIVQRDDIRLNDFGKENSWFMPMKLITEPGERNDRYLDFISENLGEGIGSNPEAPNNIEAYSYIPEVFFPYNRTDEAWKWMKYLIDKKDEAHERPTQGTNGDYPEISFTFISNTVEGLMGVEPNAPENAVVTASRLPDEVEWLEVDYLPMGDHELAIRHDGITRTEVTNTAEVPLNWEARFYGDYPTITVNGESHPARHKDINGVTVSYIQVSVSANDSAVAKVEMTQL